MTTTDATTTVRLAGRGGLLAAVPALLGFHPQESLVMVCLSGPRRRVGPVIRVDLDDLADAAAPPDGIGGPIAQLQLYAARYADEVAVMCYTESSGASIQMDAVITALEECDSRILDAVRITGGQASSWRPAHLPEVGPDDGSPVPDRSDPQVEELAAATAFNGRGILSDRQALRDSIAGPSGPEAVRASAALHAAADGLLGEIGHCGPVEVDRLLQMAESAVDAGLRQVADTGSIDPTTASSITLLLCDVEIRDAVIARAVTEREQPFVPMFIALARVTPDDDAAEVCAVLAMASYRRGDGALAQVAVDRTLATDPEHRLAHLMLGVMACGMPPEQLEELASISPGTDG